MFEFGAIFIYGAISLAIAIAVLHAVVVSEKWRKRYPILP
jgi:uncharacterized membrane protein SpoIIM required for sporulation